MTCNYLVRAQLHTLVPFDKWTVKTIIEQLRYNGNKEVKWGLEMQMKSRWSSRNFPFSAVHRAGLAHFPVMIKNDTNTVGSVAARLTRELFRPPCSFRVPEREGGLHSKQTLALISAG